MQVYYATVSAHADAKGILQLVQQVAPAAALLVHGEPDKMAFMSNKIQSSLGIKCFMPAIGEEVEINSSGCTPVPTSAQLLRKLPMTVQQLMACSSGAGGDGGAAQGVAAAAAAAGVRGQGTSAGAAAAGWLQQGDVGQLVQAAMKLAGLNAPAAAAAGGSSAGNAQQQQQQQQQLPVSAAARAAQLAPWLELLAAAAHEVRQGAGSVQEAQQQQQQQQQQPHVQPQHRQQQADQQLTSADAGVPVQQQQQPVVITARLLPDGLAVATLSQQLHQQLALESQSCILDGVLVVRHLPPKAPAEQQLVQSMQLLPAQDAAAALGLAQHSVRLRCRLKLPACCWDGSAAQQWLNTAEAGDAGTQQPEEQQQQLSQNGTAGLGFVTAVLRAGLPPSLAQQVQAEGCRVHLKSLNVAVSDSQPHTLVCSWVLHNDALAQQCISMVELAAKGM
jgi:hypothetical protein